jgi:hypothetical protein
LAVAAALVVRVRPAEAALGRCNGKKCTGHEQCCPIFDCSGTLCVPTPTCVDVQSDPRHCGDCSQAAGGQGQECDGECCHRECCFSSSGEGQVCLPHGCGCADHPLSICGAGCVDVQTDPFNCGACGTPCPAGVACEDGRCLS